MCPLRAIALACLQLSHKLTELRDMIMVMQSDYPYEYASTGSSNGGNRGSGFGNGFGNGNAFGSSIGSGRIEGGGFAGFVPSRPAASATGALHEGRVFSGSAGGAAGLRSHGGGGVERRGPAVRPAVRAPQLPEVAQTRASRGHVTLSQRGELSEQQQQRHGGGQWSARDTVSRTLDVNA